jgi:hypothetical protein
MLLKSIRFVVVFNVLMAATMAGDARAAIVNITFEGQFNTIYGAPITRSGFDIGNPIGQEQHFHEITSTAFGLPNNGTGVLLNDRDTEIFVIPNVGSGFTQFSLQSVDVATATNNFPAVNLLITGFLSNVPTGTILIAPLGGGYTTVNGASLGIIDRLVFDGLAGGGGFVLDNLTLDNAPTASSVPEPASVALFGLGAGAAVIGAARRRRAGISATRV